MNKEVKIKFEIIEIDRDYNAYSGSEFKEFVSQATADEYCKKQSWTGYEYHANKIN